MLMSFVISLFYQVWRFDRFYRFYHRTPRGPPKLPDPKVSKEATHTHTTVAWLEETLTSWVQLKMWTDSYHWSRPSPDTTRTSPFYVTSSLIGRPICLDQWELSVHIVSCTQLVNVSSNHATVECLLAPSLHPTSLPTFQGWACTRKRKRKRG